MFKKVIHTRQLTIYTLKKDSVHVLHEKQQYMRKKIISLYYYQPMTYA